eukprot:CAMPEP_0168557856 /NCGR_PEP_ID=MMETSP0413-20121227/9653_1 /TAXON_ID=136452 /ORGANISM="Filamoeba nolandi, Strain NC-AS-23-1" /LENGTH=223 /DNA_ID=CAMNT_0008588925 /DNA_START=1378 /DNA_END=2045 /DNA_ORIENTATION=+
MSSNNNYASIGDQPIIYTIKNNFRLVAVFILFVLAFALAIAALVENDEQQIKINDVEDTNDQQQQQIDSLNQQLNNNNNYTTPYQYQGIQIEFIGSITSSTGWSAIPNGQVRWSTIGDTFSNGVFTAPTKGVYSFCVHGMIPTATDGVDVRIAIGLSINGGSFFTIGGAQLSQVQTLFPSLCDIERLDQGDTVVLVSTVQSLAVTFGLSTQEPFLYDIEYKGS